MPSDGEDRRAPGRPQRTVAIVTSISLSLSIFKGYITMSASNTLIPPMQYTLHIANVSSAMFLADLAWKYIPPLSGNDKTHESLSECGLASKRDRYTQHTVILTGT